MLAPTVLMAWALRWANGEAGTKTFTVAVLGDTEVEPDETVNLMLSSPIGGATLGTPTNATLTIVLDESAQHTIMDSAAGVYLFKFWGRVSEIDSDRFTLSYGSPTPIVIRASGYLATVKTGDYASARGILRTDVSGRWLEIAPHFIMKY